MNKGTENSRRWREKHPEYKVKAAANAKEWRRTHPEQLREQWRKQGKRRAAKGPRRRFTQTPCVKCGGMERYAAGSCKACVRVAAQRRKEADPEAFRRSSNERSARYKAKLTAEQKKASSRKHNLRKSLKTFGITAEQYERMYAEQEGRCALCRKEPSGTHRLHIDHNHETGEVRALLCSKCNTAIGLMDENTELLAAAIRYLETHMTNKMQFTITSAS